MVKIHFRSGHIQDGGRRANQKWLIRYNSAADCPILLKIGRLVHFRRRDQGRERLAGRAASSRNAAALIVVFSGYFFIYM